MRHSPRWPTLLAPLLLVLLASAPVQARPGGGNTYSSSSSSSSGSSSWSSSRSSSSDSSGSGEGSVSWPVLLFFLAFSLLLSSALDRQNKRQKTWSTTRRAESEDTDTGTGTGTGTDTGPKVPGVRGAQQSRQMLERLARVGPPGPDGAPVPFDPDFSLVLFEDFLYALYTRAHEARGGGRLDTLAAWLGPQARASLEQLGRPSQVKAVVVGAMEYLAASEVRPDSPRVTLGVSFEANYTEVSAEEGERSYFVREFWKLVRSTAVKSRPREQVRVFKCPHCGAALDALRGSLCSYCMTQVDTGGFDWLVERADPMEREARGPQLTGQTEEQGTRLPTVRQEGVEERFAALLARDPALTREAFEQRLTLIFQELQEAWSNRRWEQVRPYVSDNLFQVQLYWIEAYRQAGLRNVTQNARITSVEVARVTSDTSYHAVTVRVFATGLDYTVRDSDGQLVGGSQSREREYTEYWTLIRGAGVRGTARTDKNCPSCGAPLSINMAGSCTSCSARVTSGDFDWVLSRIEQDEAYQG